MFFSSDKIASKNHCCASPIAIFCKYHTALTSYILGIILPKNLSCLILYYEFIVKTQSVSMLFYAFASTHRFIVFMHVSIVYKKCLHEIHVKKFRSLHQYVSLSFFICILLKTLVDNSFYSF